MKYATLIAALLVSTAAFAQPSFQIGPDGVEIGPRRGWEPREERIVRQEGGCRVTIIRRYDEYGRRTSRRIRECEDDDDD